MADEVRRFTATIPAGTLSTAPVTLDVSFPVRTVRTIDWRVPPGASGLMGWRLTMGGVQVIPTKSDPWVIDDGHAGTFALDGYPDSGAWQVTGYNTGAFNHSVYLVFHVDLPTPPAKARQLIAPALLGPVPDWTALPGGGRWL